MESLRESHGVDTVMGAVRVLSIRCGSRPESKAVGKEMRALRGELRELRDVYEEAHDERVAATAEIKYRDEVLDASVMMLARQANALVNGDTSDARYRALFPSAPSAQMRPVGGPSQRAYVKAILATLSDGDVLAPLQPHRSEIAKAQEALDLAVEARDTLQVTEDRASTALSIKLSEAREAYNHAWHRLNVLFPKDKALVESFFRTLTARDKGREAPEDPPVQPK